VIRDALKPSRAVVECCDAIDWLRSRAFHMGQNDRRKRYNASVADPQGQARRRTTREQIDFFLDIAEKRRR
jgi:hypothetical protein